MNKVADAPYCLTRTDGGLVMILDSRGICAPGTEYPLLAKISMNYTSARLYEYRPHAIVDPMPGVCSTGCNGLSAMRM